MKRQWIDWGAIDDWPPPDPLPVKAETRMLVNVRTWRDHSNVGITRTDIGAITVGALVREIPTRWLSRLALHSRFDDLMPMMLAATRLVSDVGLARDARLDRLLDSLIHAL